MDQPPFLALTIYPIPTTGILTIDARTKIARIEIYNRLGQLVLANSNQQEIDMSSLNQGIYFCKILDENGSFGIEKVVKE